MGKRGRKPVVYTRERAELVRRRVRAGERITYVCRDLGMNHSNFQRWCRRNGFVVNTPESRAQLMRQPKGPYPIGEIVERPRQPRPGGRAAAIVDDLKAGLPPKRIAAERGVTYVYVLRLRKLSGLNPPAGPGRYILDERSQERRKAVAAGLREGLTLKAIAQQLGLSYSRVCYIKRVLQNSQDN